MWAFPVPALCAPHWPACPRMAPIDEVAELVKRTAFKITRVGQLVANLASQALGVPAGIIDLSLAPSPRHR